MGKEEESPQITRRATRSLKNTKEPSKTRNLESLTVDDLVHNDEQINYNELINILPGRKVQINELLCQLGPLNSRMIPLFIYGGASTGKTSTVLNIFRHLNRPFIYSSCLTCYNPRILFESVLNQLSLHRKSENNGYSSAKKCEKPSDFVNLLRDALNGVVDNLKGPNGKMVYLVFDNLEIIREWDKSSNILPFLFKLNDILKIQEVGIIFISNASPDTYYLDTGYVEPNFIYFPDYSEDDLREIFMKNQENPKIYSSFLELVLKPFTRITRRVDELSTCFRPLYAKYCEPLTNSNEEMTKSELYSHLKPYVALSLNEIFRVPPQLMLETSGYKEDIKRKGRPKKSGVYENLDEIDFQMSISGKYLLISAFLASRNPATLDASFFDSTGGSDNRKRRKTSEKSKELKENAEQEILMKGPGTFPLERLLAIFQCLTDYLPDEEEQNNAGVKSESKNNGLMCDILLQLSSLCNANFISKGSTCPLEGSTRYRSTISEDMALKVARSLKFPLSRYLYK